MKRFFKSPWLFVAITFYFVTFIPIISEFLGEVVGGWVLRQIPSNNQRVMSAVLILVQLVFPLILAYYVGKWYLNRGRKGGFSKL